MPDFRREGEDYVASWDDPQIELVFNRVRTTDTRATAWAYAYGTDNGRRGSLMAPLSMTLTETASRQRLVGHLCQRTGMAATLWSERVEQAISLTLTAVFEPEPLVNLAEYPLKEDQGYLFENFLPLGELTVLLADQGSSKSYLLLYLLTCIALDLESIFGRPNVSGPVFYYDTETTADAHRRRLERLARAMGLLRLPNIQYRRMTGRIIDAERQIRTEVARYGPVALGVDSLTYASGGNLNDSESAGATVNLIGDLPATVTKIATAHHGKQQRGAKMEDASVIGSSLFEFKASGLWVLRRETEDTGDARDFNVLMVNRKMRDGARAKSMVYNLAFDNAARKTTFTRGSTAQLGNLDRDLPTRERVSKVLARATRPLKTREVAEELELAESTVKKELNGLAERGLATNINRSDGGRGNSGIWVAGAPSTDPNKPFRPIDKSTQNGFGAPDGANRSVNRSDKPFQTVPGTDTSSRVGNSGLAATGTGDVEELGF